jgi:allophycocyanin-B
MQLSERAKQLIPLSRIVSFETWQDSDTAPAQEIFQQADDEGRYLSDRDIEQLKILLPSHAENLEFARLLRDRADRLVDNARKQVLAQYPGITETGGELYPPERAEACWRDFWHFLRCITYGIAGQRIPYTSPEGLKNMQLLYQELRVPLEAMKTGLLNLKKFSLQQFNSQQQAELSPYFEHLIEAIKQFN